MDWTTPYIVYRLTEENTFQEVFWAEDIKKAKYWLTYIAQAGDVLCKTPVHPKHSKQTKHPEYWSHKESSGQPCSNEHAWRELVGKEIKEIKFPDQQTSLPPET